LSGIGKLAIRRTHTGDYKVDQQQRLAQAAAVVTNSHRDMLNALVNRAYAELATDTGTLNVAAYTTLLTANITTVLATGYLLITVSSSGAQVTNAATVYLQVTVDGVVKRACYATVNVAWSWSLAMVVRVPVTRGPHVVTTQWKSNQPSVHINPLTVNGEHASLLVQEAA
jgi:hypothetical protein